MKYSLSLGFLLAIPVLSQDGKFWNSLIDREWIRLPSRAKLGFERGSAPLLLVVEFLLFPSYNCFKEGEYLDQILSSIADAVARVSL
jgi:hypothetical protein